MHGEQDDWLRQLTSELRTPAAAPAALWRRIEIEIELGRERDRARRRGAVCVLVALGLVVLLPAPRDAASALVGDAEARALTSEEQHWQRHVHALAAQLANQPRIVTSACGATLRAQLELVSANIETCRKQALANALNRTVRRALIASYRQQADLLARVLADQRDT
ncbi:MAG: hypothetical protein U1E76_13525 [Planctomycetota bacterium]